MEYDRALYRVYERVMEDLVASPSPLPPPPDNGEPHLLPPPLPFCHPIWATNTFNLIQSSLVRLQHSVSRRGDAPIDDDPNDGPAVPGSTTTNPLLSHHAERARTRIRMSLDRRSSLPPSDVQSQSSSDLQSSSWSSSSLDGGNHSLGNHSSDNHSSDNHSSDNLMSNQNRTCTQSGCWKLGQVFLFAAVLHVGIIWRLHTTYVVRNNSLSETNRNCMAYALETRDVGLRSGYLSPTKGKREEEKEEDTEQEKVSEKESEVSLENELLLGDDEILQIKILYGGKCTGKCSRVRVLSDANTTAEGASDASDSSDLSDLSSENRLNSLDYWEKVHYRFSTSEALLYLEDGLLHKQNITLVNVTITERCLSTGNDGTPSSFQIRLAEMLSQIYSTDTAVINSLMKGITSPLTEKDRKDDKHNPLIPYHFRSGYLQNIASNERWSWSKYMLKADYSNHHIYRNPISWLFDKTILLFVTLLNFFLMTSITALIVRVLTSSGVVLMFPLFSLIRSIGVPNADDRILGLSYPWIGTALDQIRRSNRSLNGNGPLQPTNHFICAHLCKIFLYYCMYEASEAAWSILLYGKSVPESLPIWLYGYAMIWEYFCMVFVRSAMSAFLFPRLALGYFMAYHVYFYSVPYAYFDVALLPLFFFGAHGMMYTVLACEIPAVERGSVSAECPREVYNRVCWSEWISGLPPEWTLFLPLNTRYTPLYDRVVEEGEVGLDQDTRLTEHANTVLEEAGGGERNYHAGSSHSPSVVVVMDELPNPTGRSGLYARRVNNESLVSSSPSEDINRQGSHGIV